MSKAVVAFFLVLSDSRFGSSKPLLRELIESLDCIQSYRVDFEQFLEVFDQSKSPYPFAHTHIYIYRHRYTGI